MSVMICGICDVLPSKYKCPKCRVPYCSLQCWKTHKEGECSVNQEEKIKSSHPVVQVNERQKATYNYPTDDTVPPEKLRLLEGSRKLKDILSNPHVRASLADVDNATDPARAIQSAMLEPIFMEFADECMNILEPWTKEELREEKLLN